MDNGGCFSLSISKNLAGQAASKELKKSRFKTKP